MENLSTTHHHRNFARMLKVAGKDGPRINVNPDELRRFSLVQVKISRIFFLYCFLIIINCYIF